MRTSITGKPNIESLRRRGDVPGLIDALGFSRSLNVRKEAHRALVGMGKRAVEFLTEALMHRDHNVRRWAARALGDIGDTRAVRGLFAALRDEDILVCHAASVALSNIRGINGRTWDAIRVARRRFEKACELMNADDERAVDHLIAYLSHDNEIERWEAAARLGHIRSPRAVPALMVALGDESHMVRMVSVRTLGSIGDPRAVDSLISVLDDQDLNLRCYACWALGRIGDSLAVEALVRTMYDGESKVTMAAATALGRIGDRRAVEPLAALLVDEDETVRRAVVRALGRFGEVSKT